MSVIEAITTRIVSISELKMHPKNVEIYGDEDVTDLSQSISESGWIRPLTVTPDLVIIGGHRRYRACLLLGITEVPVVIETFPSPEAEEERLLLENENRDKTPEQQIREGMTWEPIEEKKATGRARKRTDLMDETDVKIFTSESGRIKDIIARRVGLGSGRTYEAGKEVVVYMDRMLKVGSERGPILKMTLNDDSINASSKAMKKYLQLDKDAEDRAQRQEDERIRLQELARQRYLAAVEKAEHCKLYHCSVAEFADPKYVQPESVDYIITDPPYPAEFLPVYDDLASFAAYALKPGGSLIAMVGQSYLPEIIEKLGKWLNYHWMLAYLTPGGQSPQLWQKNVNSFWKPLLWYVKGEYTSEWIGDVCKSDVNHNDKSKHHWGQSTSGVTDIVGRFTKPNQLICDPFVGGGTTAVVCMEMKRRFVGCDTDETCVLAAEEKKKSIIERSI